LASRNYFFIGAQNETVSVADARPQSRSGINLLRSLRFARISQFLRVSVRERHCLIDEQIITA